MSAQYGHLGVLPEQEASCTSVSQPLTFTGRCLQKTSMVALQQHREAIAFQHKEHPPLHEQHAVPEEANEAEKDEKDEEGFTRSISLYWTWAKTAQAAAKLGKGLARNSTALILQCEHWLEAADPKHRYGTNLRPYFDYWLNQQTKGRDAATSGHNYIPYSAIPEIAAQAAAEAATNSGSNNGNAGVPVTEQLCSAGATCTERCHPCGSSAAAVAAAAGSNTDPPPATPRRSRSAPNLAELHDAATPAANSEDEEQVEEEDEEAAATPSDGDAACTPRLPGAFTAAYAAGSSSKHQQQFQHWWQQYGVLPPVPPALQASASVHLGVMSGLPPLPGIHTDDRFFYWLDEGSGRHVDLADRGVPRGKLESERVQYLTEAERDQLEVTVDPSSGLLVYKISGQTVHTGSELSLVQVRSSNNAVAAAGGGDAATGGCAAAACCAADGSSRDVEMRPSLQQIPEAACEEEEEEEEEEQQVDELQGSQQHQRRQQQQAALQQLQENLWQQQPMCADQLQQAQQQEQQQMQRQGVLQDYYQHQQQQQQQQQQAFSHLQHSLQPAAGGMGGAAAVAHQRPDIDVEMEDVDSGRAAAADTAAGLAVCSTPSTAAALPGSSFVDAAAGAAAAVTATPTAAAYGAVAGHATPGTTCISQRRQSLPFETAQQQEHGSAAAASRQQEQQQPYSQQNGVHSSADEVSAAATAAPPAVGPGSLLQIKEKPCKWIYVLDTSGRLFVHAKYRGKFHHSSFLQGGAVLSAGGIVVEHGRIMKLTADSGHYRPNFDSFMSTVQMLKDRGADLSQTKLSAKHIKCPKLPEVGPS